MSLRGSATFLPRSPSPNLGADITGALNGPRAVRVHMGVASVIRVPDCPR